MLILLVEDVKKLNSFLDTEGKRVCLKVKDNHHLYAELALAQVILFNRRGGEAKNMTSAFSEAKKIDSRNPDDDVLSTPYAVYTSEWK